MSEISRFRCLQAKVWKLLTPNLKYCGGIIPLDKLDKIGRISTMYTKQREKYTEYCSCLGRGS